MYLIVLIFVAAPRMPAAGCVSRRARGVRMTHTIYLSIEITKVGSVAETKLTRNAQKQRFKRLHFVFIRLIDVPPVVCGRAGWVRAVRCGVETLPEIFVERLGRGWSSQRDSQWGGAK